jgi:hypothetical protein
MRRFLYAVCLFGAIIPLETNAQVSQADALRYSQDILGGTARFSAMGGAFAAVGGDISTLAYNPGGIAVFTKNELEISPGLTLQSTNASNGSNNVTNQGSSINIQSFGLIATKKIAKKNKDDAGGWKSYNFGLAYNRMNNFNDNISISTISHTNSFADGLTQAAQGTYYQNLDGFYLNPAFQIGILDTVPGSNYSNYFNILDQNLNTNGNYLLQTENITTTGSMGETDISFGGNYNDKLFIGATVGIVDVNYNLTDVYTETAEYDDQLYGLNSYSFTQNLNTSGAGVNFKLGFIYRIMDWLRIGGAIHSPTFLSLTDNYSTSWMATYNSITPEYFYPGPTEPAGNQTAYSYNIATPLKAIGGAAVIINNQGIVSADYEYVNYSTMSFNSSDPNLSPDYGTAVNNAIGQQFIQANNLRFGFEWVLYPVSFRAGYAIYGNPYNSSTVGYSSPRTTYSAGIGLKVNNVYFDFAYTLMQYSEQYAFYSGAETTTLKNNISNVIFTLGYKFGNGTRNRMPRRERFQPYPPPPPPPPPGAY